MNLDELKEKYRGAPLGARAALMAAVGLLPAIYFYTEDSTVIEEQLAASEQREEELKAKFEKDSNTKASIQKLELERNFIAGEYAKARKSLPDTYRIEDVLERAATLAKESGTTLKLFKPGKETKYESPSRYAELPIAAEIEGRFAQVAAFFDRVVHLESMIFVRDLDLKKGADSTARPAANGAVESGPLALAMGARNGVRVNATFNFYVYRGLADSEVVAGGGAESEPGTATTPNALAPKGAPP